MASSAPQLRQLGRACDRCYELKERCKRASTTITCARCDRLGQTCLTIRPVRPVGRRPQQREEAASNNSPSQQNTVTQYPHITRLCNIPDLRPEEKELLMFFLGRPDALEYCVISPSFNDAEQRSFAAPLPAALPVLKDAYLACAGALRSLYHGNETEVDSNANLRRASSAMKTLRSLPVDSPEDAAVWRFMEIAVLDPETEPLLSFLVLLETMECIVHRRKPTFRIQLRNSESVDRHLGLCLPLLPYFYDLCVINHSLANATDARVLARLQQELDSIQSVVDVWQPSQPEDFIQQFESAEIVHLLAQARVYRLAALLLSHRLRYVFGQEDSQADFWSKEIMRELELAQRVTKRPTHCVTLPFVIAAIEIRGSDARMKTFQDVARYVDRFTPVVQKATRLFLIRVWKERDIRIGCSWFTSIYKPCIILNTIL
ncbi:uncharacterized protein PAC_20149 [Phialocephala subalpina]|uniref:Zn(2)-C6 fungal-type domain-containing protein n=1 Tax=Phialocephala subalpina TaxID=576137 RepID=A0A1L7XYZ7_9HELO|nr:uncharacterized protein PAC_20149 [Phialocephala subalpina]